MALRQEILSSLESSDTQIIPLSPKARKHAIENQGAARNLYEEARGEILEHDLASFYRVVIFGSKSFTREDPEYQFVVNLAKSLVEARDVDIVTGGGPGVMEAALYGAELAKEEAFKNGRKLKALTHGVSMSTLPIEEDQNEYIHISSKHPEFSTRLQEFLDKTRAAYFAPGGIGTLLELAMVVQTKQVNHLEQDYPILAHPFWEPVIETCNHQMFYSRENNGQTPLISENDLALVHYTDNIAEITGTISKSYDRWQQSIRSRVRFLRRDKSIKIAVQDLSGYPTTINLQANSRSQSPTST